MKYRKLELIFLISSLIAVLVSIVISLAQGANFAEILGQAIFIPIIFISLHYGRQAGFLAATFGALTYLIARVQEINTLNFSTMDGQMIIVRAALFGFVGIFGSEVTGRSKYLIARFSDRANLDEETKLFSQEYMQKLILRLLYEHRRYGRFFSIIFLTCDWPISIGSKIRKSKLLKISSALRENVRLVDEVGYVNDNCFCCVLPETDAIGADLALERLKKTVFGGEKNFYNLINLRERVLCFPDNQTEIKNMLPAEIVAKFIA